MIINRNIKIKAAVFCMIMLLIVMSLLSGCGGQSEPGGSTPPELTKPQITGGSRGELGIDRNINEANIDDYLGRDDAVYRDMRMLEDPAQYENIGGDRFLSGYIEGFEVVPLPYIIPVNGLPNAVGDTYTGQTLFEYNDNYVLVPAYEESMQILEELFPKDKVIFLMCGGGGYAGMMKNFLISMGWDPDKIYNVGGHWFYNGEHNVQVKHEENGQVTYDFDSVPYHDIDFNSLTRRQDDTPDDVKVTGVVLGADTFELEEDSSFQMNAVVCPAAACDQSVTWTSEDPSVVAVDYGLLRGVKPGTTKVTVTTTDGGFTASCEVTVTAREITEPVVLDDLSAEAETFAENSPNDAYADFYKIEEDMEQAVKDGYYTYDGEGYVPTDLWREELDKVEKKVEEEVKVRTEILNKLIDEKKSFILLIYTKSCEERQYQAVESAAEILGEKGIPYFYTSDMASGNDKSLYESKIDYNMAARSTIVIFRDGEIYAGMNPDAVSIKSDEELISWLGKYIKM